MPAGKAILLPVINFVISFLEEPDLKTDSDLVFRARSDVDDITTREAAINGQVISDLSRYRVRSDPFDFIFPIDNLFAIPPGLTRCVSDGYWLFIRYLPFKENKVSVNGACSLGRTSVHVDYEIILEGSDYE